MPPRAASQALKQALGDKRGIGRYAWAAEGEGGDVEASPAALNLVIPMDETLTRVALDMSNRPYLVWRVNFSRPKLGEMDTELFSHWFASFAQTAGITLHLIGTDHIAGRRLAQLQLQA